MPGEATRSERLVENEGISAFDCKTTPVFPFACIVGNHEKCPLNTKSKWLVTSKSGYWDPLRTLCQNEGRECHPKWAACPQRATCNDLIDITGSSLPKVKPKV